VRESRTLLAVTEIIFEVHHAEEAGFWARARGLDVFTQGNDWGDLRAMVEDAVACHFGDAEKEPKIIGLTFN
jgi:hypothetical protein